MPKIRGIKPEFWTDEDIVELSMPARLLFIGMWNFACDNGHLDDKPKQLRMRILPTDSVNVGKLLDELVQAGRISRHDGVIEIHKFAHHQKPHRRWWTTCDLPFCRVPTDAPPQGRNGGEGVSDGGSQPLRNSGATVDPGGATADGDGEGDGDSDIPRAGKPAAAKRASQLADDWRPSDEHAKLAAERGIDLGEEADKFRDWCRANGATKKDWEAAFRNWLRNARTTGNVRPFPQPDEQGRIPLGPLPPRSPWGSA